MEYDIIMWQKNNESNGLKGWEFDKRGGRNVRVWGLGGLEILGV